MLHLLPFVVGAAAGVAGVLILGDKKTKKKIAESKKYVETKLSEGKDSVVAIGECVKEKVKSKKEQKEGENSEPKL